MSERARYFFRVKHPTALVGPWSLTFKGQDIHGELDRGELEITEEMGGALLVRYLVNQEGYKDLSQYAPDHREGPLKVVDKSYKWDLEHPLASRDNPYNGTVGIFVNGEPKQLVVVDNIIMTKDPAVRAALVQDGFRVVKAYEREEPKAAPVITASAPPVAPAAPSPVEPEQPAESSGVESSERFGVRPKKKKAVGM